jgi:hypothetical protein
MSPTELDVSNIIDAWAGRAPAPLEETSITHLADLARTAIRQRDEALTELLYCAQAWKTFSDRVATCGDDQ